MAKWSGHLSDCVGSSLDVEKVGLVPVFGISEFIYDFENACAKHRRTIVKACCCSVRREMTNRRVMRGKKGVEDFTIPENNTNQDLRTM